MKFRIIVEEGKATVDFYDQQRKSVLAAAAILRELGPYNVYSSEEIPETVVTEMERLAGVEVNEKSDTKDTPLFDAADEGTEDDGNMLDIVGTIRTPTNEELPL